jgi:glutathione reductase (NADPH)
MHDFDLFVIGAGSGGVRAARTAAALGARVAVAEERYLGGTCVNVGCIPKKLYAQAAHYRHDFTDSAGFGWDLALPTLDWPRLRANKKREIARLNGIYQNLLETAGVTLFNARAELLDAHTVQVAGKPLTAAHILVATGGWPHLPDIPGKELAVSSNEIFDLDTFPQRIMIVGGGYIGVEFAGIFAGLGAETLLVHRGDLPLKGFDLDLRQRFLHEAGKHVQVLLNTDVKALHTAGIGQVTATLQDGAVQQVNAVLFATGRKPNTSGLGLDKAGVALNKNGTIAVDACFQTSVPSIHAIGDVVGRLALTPVALAEGMLLANHLFGDKRRQLTYSNIPTAVFSQPNLATVGLSEEDALARYPEVAIFETDFRQLKHTLSGRDERTYMKVVVDVASDLVLGMHMLGDEAGEILQGFVAAMVAGVTKANLDATIGIHPTMAEEFVTLRKASRVVTGKGPGSLNP